MPQAWSEWGIWSYAATATQSNVAGGTVIIDVTAGAGNVVHVLYGQAVGASAGAKLVDWSLLDEDNNAISFASQLSAAAAVVTFPRALTNIDSNSSTLFAASLGGFVLAGTDLKLAATGASMAQNDTLQILIVAKVKNGPGSISVARSGGTVSAPTVTVNEVY